MEIINECRLRLSIMSENKGENEIWCRAWRLLVKHMADVDAVIYQEIENCVTANDEDGADYWRRVLAALDDLR